MTAMTTVSPTLLLFATCAPLLMYVMGIFTSHITRNSSPHAPFVCRSLLTDQFHFLFHKQGFGFPP